VALALVSGLALVATACGDDDDDDAAGDTATTVATETSAGGTATTAGGSAAGGGDAQAFVDELTKRPTAIAQTEKFVGNVPADKTIMWIQCPVPACVQLEQPLEDATTALGWTLKTVPHEGTPESVKAAYEQAVREAPDAVISSGFPRSIFEVELEQLAAKDIPVVQVTVTDEPTDGITAVVNGPGRNARVGEQLANFVAADSGGAANIVWVTTGYPILTPELEGLDGTGGFEPTVTALCPDCTVEVLDLPLEAIGTDAIPRTVAHLQANPDVNYVVGAFGDIVNGLPGALADAGLADKVKIVTYTQNPALSAALEAGEIEAVVGFPGAENMWQAVDVLLRSFAGQPFEPAWNELPSWIITAENVPSTTEDFPLVEDYQDQYKALWGVA
jgi:ribose transport system substrate-binding protein